MSYNEDRFVVEATLDVFGLGTRNIFIVAKSGVTGTDVIIPDNIDFFVSDDVTDMNKTRAYDFNYHEITEIGYDIKQVTDMPGTTTPYYSESISQSTTFEIRQTILNNSVATSSGVPFPPTGDGDFPYVFVIGIVVIGNDRTGSPLTFNDITASNLRVYFYYIKDANYLNLELNFTTDNYSIGYATTTTVSNSTGQIPLFDYDKINTVTLNFNFNPNPPNDTTTTNRIGATRIRAATRGGTYR